MENVVDVRKIKEFQKGNGLSKTSFCKLCKISVATLNRIYSGKDFYLITLFKIAKAMGVRVCELFNKSV